MKKLAKEFMRLLRWHKCPTYGSSQSNQTAGRYLKEERAKGGGNLESSVKSTISDCLQKTRP